MTDLHNCPTPGSSNCLRLDLVVFDLVRKPDCEQRSSCSRSLIRAPPACLMQHTDKSTERRDYQAIRLKESSCRNMGANHNSISLELRTSRIQQFPCTAKKRYRNWFQKPLLSPPTKGGDSYSPLLLLRIRPVMKRDDATANISPRLSNRSGIHRISEWTKRATSAPECNGGGRNRAGLHLREFSYGCFSNVPRSGLGISKSIYTCGASFPAGRPRPQRVICKESLNMIYPAGRDNTLNWNAGGPRHSLFFCE